MPCACQDHRRKAVFTAPVPAPAPAPAPAPQAFAFFLRAGHTVAETLSSSVAQQPETAEPSVALPRQAIRNGKVTTATLRRAAWQGRPRGTNLFPLRRFKIDVFPLFVSTGAVRGINSWRSRDPDFLFFVIPPMALIQCSCCSELVDVARHAVERIEQRLVRQLHVRHSVVHRQQFCVHGIARWQLERRFLGWKWGLLTHGVVVRQT